MDCSFLPQSQWGVFSNLKVSSDAIKQQYERIISAVAAVASERTLLGNDPPVSIEEDENDPLVAHLVSPIGVARIHLDWAIGQREIEGRMMVQREGAADPSGMVEYQPVWEMRIPYREAPYVVTPRGPEHVNFDGFHGKDATFTVLMTILHRTVTGPMSL